MNFLPTTKLPFEIVGRKYSDLTEHEGSFFIGDEYLPLHPDHDAQIILLDRESADRIKSFARAGFVKNPSGDFARLPLLDHQFLHDKWNSESDIQDVREWLHSLEIPYAQSVFLWYDNAVVATTWKLLLRYWDAFAWSVGVAMHAFDHTLTWVCEFHHEDVISFYAFPKSSDA